MTIFSAILDPEIGGRIFAIAYMLQGLLLTLCSMQQLPLYGWSTSKLAYLMVDETGSAILTTGVVACLLQFYHTSVQTAFGYAGLVWLMSLVKWYLNDTWKDAGSSNRKLTIPLITTLMVVYGGFFDPSWADIANMTISGAYILMALYAILLPDSFGKTWGLDITVEKKGQYYVTHFGVFFMIYHLHKLLLLQDIAAHKALGYSSLVGLIFFVDGYVGSKNVIRILEKPKSPYLFWLVFFMLMCPNTLYHGKTGLEVNDEL